MSVGGREMKKLIVPALAAIMLAAACGGPGGGSPVEYDPSPSPPPPAPVMEMAADGVVGGMSKQAYSEAPSRPV